MKTGHFAYSALAIAVLACGGETATRTGQSNAGGAGSQNSGGSGGSHSGASNNGGEAGQTGGTSSGSGGSGGSAGQGATAGVGGAGNAGNAGNAGTAGMGGVAGSAGVAGTGAMGGVPTTCFSPDGSVPSVPYKVCTNDADCMVVMHTADCCGSIQQVGISSSQEAAYDTCEASWLASLPECGCASNIDVADDGQQVNPGDSVGVGCSDFVGNSGICKSYVIPGTGGAGGGGGAPAFPANIAGIWLIGWSGGLNHYSWIKFHDADNWGGVAQILAGDDLSFNSPYWPCSGEGSWFLAQKIDTVAINFPSGCPTAFQALTFSNFTSAPPYPQGADMQADVEDEANPGYFMQGFHFPDSYCDTAFTTCGNPLLPTVTAQSIERATLVR